MADEMVLNLKQEHDSRQIILVAHCLLNLTKLMRISRIQYGIAFWICLMTPLTKQIKF